MTIGITMCKLFAALAVGYILNKMDILDSVTCKKISALILNVSSPMLIITSVTTVSGERSPEVFHLFLMGVAAYAILPFLSYGLVRLFGIKKDLRGTYMCMIIFANCVFMGFPVIEAVYGSSAIFYSSIFHMPFNLLFYTIGMILIDRDANAAKEKPNITIGQVLNNGVIASVIALLVYATNFTIPEIIVEPMRFIGGVTSPLSMMVIGSSIAGYSIKEILGQKNIYIFTILRIVILPALFWALMHLFTDNEMMIGIVTITIGMPVGALVAMGASRYDKQGKEASIAVVCSTIFSLITIPILCVLLGVG